MSDVTPRVPEGLDLFEVYEANGSLLYVSSFLDSRDFGPSDVIFRRPWATAAKPLRRTENGNWETP